MTGLSSQENGLSKVGVTGFLGQSSALQGRSDPRVLGGEWEAGGRRSVQAPRAPDDVPGQEAGRGAAQASARGLTRSAPLSMPTKEGSALDDRRGTLFTEKQRKGQRAATRVWQQQSTLAPSEGSCPTSPRVTPGAGLGTSARVDSGATTLARRPRQATSQCRFRYLSKGKNESSVTWWGR